MARKNDKRKSFVFMADWIPLIRILSKQETDDLFRMIKAVIEGKDVPDCKGDNLPEVWEFIKDKLSDNIERYEEVKARRLANLAKANASLMQRKCDANATQMRSICDANAIHSQGVTVTDTVTDTVTVLPTIVGNGRENTKEKRSFSRPSLAEVERFVIDNSYDDLVSAEAFFDYYESNGWKVGKVSMKDWRAAVRMWASRARKEQTEKQDSFLNIDWGDGE